MNRRNTLQAVLAVSAWSWARVAHAQSTLESTALTPLLRTGGCVVMLRHAQTVPGTGDPPNFNLSQCSTQRNLSDGGREQAKRMGQWFKARGLRPVDVLSSAWCRCIDTANLAFGQHTVLPALNSFFENRSTEAFQTRQLRQRLQTIQAGQFEVWITHQVNISALTGEPTAMGEALVIKAGADGQPVQLLGRIGFI